MSWVLVWSGLVWAGRWAGLGGSGLGWLGLVAGLVAGLVWSRLRWAGLC